MVTVAGMGHKVERLFAEYGPPAIGVINFFRTVVKGEPTISLEAAVQQFIERVTLQKQGVLPTTLSAYIKRLLSGDNLSRLGAGIAAVIGGKVGPDVAEGHGTLFKGITDTGWALVGSTIAGAIFDDPPTPNSNRSNFISTARPRIAAQG